MSKPYKFSWILVIYAGSLTTQFTNYTTNTLLIIWGLLITAGIVITSILLDWDNDRLKKVHAYWIGSISLMYLFTILYFNLESLTFLHDFNIWLYWAVFFSVGFLITAVLLKRKIYFLIFLLQILLIPLLMMPQIEDFNALIFGLSESILLILAMI